MYVSDFIFVMQPKTNALFLSILVQIFPLHKLRAPSTNEDTLVTITDQSILGTTSRTVPEIHFKLTVLFERVILQFQSNCLTLNPAKPKLLNFS